VRCRDAVEKLSAHLDGELDPAESRSVEEHLSQCPECERKYVLLTATRRAVRRVALEAVSDRFDSEFRSRLAAEGGTRRAGTPRRRAISLFVGLAAAIALVVLTGRHDSQAPGTASGSRPLPIREGSRQVPGYLGACAQCRLDAPCASAATCGLAMPAIDAGLDLTALTAGVSDEPADHGRATRLLGR
jgi:hypothetical protein